MMKAPIVGLNQTMCRLCNGRIAWNTDRAPVDSRTRAGSQGLAECSRNNSPNGLQSLPFDRQEIDSFGHHLRLAPCLENLFSGPEDALRGLIGDLAALQPALDIAPALCQARKP